MPSKTPYFSKFFRGLRPLAPAKGLRSPPLDPAGGCAPRPLPQLARSARCAAALNASARFARQKPPPKKKPGYVPGWKMLGHVLRSGDDTPAFFSFRFACLGCLDYKGRRGRPRSNLFDLLLKDIMTKNIIVIVNKRLSLSNFNDLVYNAHDRRLWRSYG